MRKPHATISHVYSHAFVLTGLDSLTVPCQPRRHRRRQIKKRHWSGFNEVHHIPYSGHAGANVTQEQPGRLKEWPVLKRIDNVPHTRHIQVPISAVKIGTDGLPVVSVPSL